MCFTYSLLFFAYFVLGFFRGFGGLWRGKYFGKLGVEVKNTTNGAMRPFMDVIDEVAVKWKTFTSTQREEFLSGFGMHHASRLGAFIGANSEFHKAKDQVIPNTPADSAQKEYERVTDTFNNKWQSMMTSIKALTQTIFTPLMKALQPIIQGITKVSEVLRNMTMNNEGLATLVSGFITLSTVAVLAVGGAMLLSGALFKLNGLFVAGAFKTNIFTKALEAVRITMRNLYVPSKQQEQCRSTAAAADGNAACQLREGREQ